MTIKSHLSSLTSGSVRWMLSAGAITLCIATIGLAAYLGTHKHSCGSLSRWEALACYREDIRVAYAHGGYDAALHYIQSLPAWRDPTDTQCHWIMHALGAVVYDATKDPVQALRILNPSCSGGYMHGVLEAYVNENGKHFTLKPEMIMDACEANKDHLFAWECYHGLGHALTRALGNDTFATLKLCDSLTGPIARERCYYGVFMENAYSYDNGYDGPPKTYQYPDGNLQLCAQVSERQKRPCYRFSGHSYLAAIINARKASIHTMTLQDVKDAYNNACSRIESSSYRAQCASGIPIYMYTAWEGDADRMKEGCASFTRQIDRTQCYGLSATIFARYDIEHKGLAQAFCSTLSPADRDSCNSIAAEGKDFFGSIIFNYEK